MPNPLAPASWTTTFLPQLAIAPMMAGQAKASDRRTVTPQAWSALRSARSSGCGKKWKGVPGITETITVPVHDPIAGTINRTARVYVWCHAPVLLTCCWPAAGMMLTCC